MHPDHAPRPDALDRPRAPTLPLTPRPRTGRTGSSGSAARTCVRGGQGQDHRIGIQIVHGYGVTGAIAGEARTFWRQTSWSRESVIVTPPLAGSGDTPDRLGVRARRTRLMWPTRPLQGSGACERCLRAQGAKPDTREVRAAQMTAAGRWSLFGMPRASAALPGARVLYLMASPSRRNPGGRST
jgi:hypothetical protein